MDSIRKFLISEINGITYENVGYAVFLPVGISSAPMINPEIVEQ